MTLPVIVDVELPAAIVPPVTFKLPFAVRLAPLPIVNVPLLEVVSPVTLPAPFQLPPVTPNVPPMVAPLPKLMIPVPLSVAFPLIVPVPVNVPAVPTLTVLPEAIEPLTVRVPALTFVAPVYVFAPPRTTVPAPVFVKPNPVPVMGTLALIVRVPFEPTSKLPFALSVNWKCLCPLPGEIVSALLAARNIKSPAVEPLTLSVPPFSVMLPVVLLLPELVMVRV